MPTSGIKPTSILSLAKLLGRVPQAARNLIPREIDREIRERFEIFLERSDDM